MSMAGTAVDIQVERSLKARRRAWLSGVARSSDKEFLPAALEILERPPSPMARGMVGAIALLFGSTLAWSYVGRIDIVAQAQGKFQPTGRVKLVQPVETGKVAAIRADNGTAVHAGDSLVELDTREAQAEAREARSMAQSYAAEVVRRGAETALVEDVQDEAAAPPSAPWSSMIAKRVAPVAAAIRWPEGMDAGIVERERHTFRSDMTQLSSQMLQFEAQLQAKASERQRLVDTIRAQKALVATLQSRVDMKTTLMASQSGSKANVIDATETLQYQQTALAQQTGQLAEAETAQGGIRADMAKAVQTFLADDAQKSGDAQRQAESYRQQALKAEARLANAVLRSPIDGVVQSSTLTSVGQVVTAGEEVMRVVPSEGGLEIEAYLPNRDVGFVAEGQEATVKVESFPFTRYGTLKAKVVRVGRDAVPQPDASQTEGDPAVATRLAGMGGAQRVQNLVFPVTLKAERSTIDVDGKEVALSPGMAVSAEIRTGDRRILEYLFSPLTQVSSEAMKER